MINFKSISDLVSLSITLKKPISEIVWEWESTEQETDRVIIWEKMEQSFAVMQQAIQRGINQQGKCMSGFSGGDAYKLNNANINIIGNTIAKATAYAVAVSEVNADMGRIVACPTAGSCGIVPGAVFAVQELLHCDNSVIIKALFTAAGVGQVIADQATVSGAVGGCQAECGTASAMAAAAVVEMMGGTAEESAQALALSLKNMLGLVCDPVAGLVEVPCIKRNGFAASHALVAAHMAMAGVKSIIPPDEIIKTMLQIGLDMPRTLKETSQGGLAKTPTALKMMGPFIK